MKTVCVPDSQDIYASNLWETKPNYLFGMSQHKKITN